MPTNMRFPYFCLLAGVLILTGCGGAGTSSPSSQPSGNLLVAVDRNLLTQDSRGTHQETVATSDFSGLATLSLDGHTIAMPTRGSDNLRQVLFVDAVVGNGHVEFSGLPESSVAISPDNMAMAYIDGATATRQIKTADRLTQAVSNWGPAIQDLVPVRGLAWDSQNRFIATVQGSNVESVVLVPRDPAGSVITVGEGDQPAFSVDGATLAYVTTSGDLGLYDVASRTKQTFALSAKIENVQFSRDGFGLYVTAIRPDGPAGEVARVAYVSLDTKKLSYVAAQAQGPQSLVGEIVR